MNNDRKKWYFKKIGKEIRHNCKNLYSNQKFFALWKKFLQKDVKEESLYGAKVDLHDAFGSVDIGN